MIRTDSSGDLSGGETPGPIPNPEVKPVSADGTGGTHHWESRSSPARNLFFFAQRELLFGGSLFLWMRPQEIFRKGLFLFGKRVPMAVSALTIRIATYLHVCASYAKINCLRWGVVQW